MASTQSLQCITGCLLFSAQVRYFQPRCVDTLATGKGPSPSHRWLSFVCTLLRFFRAPGMLAFHSGVAREGNNASVHCVVVVPRPRSALVLFWQHSVTWLHYLSGIRRASVCVGCLECGSPSPLLGEYLLRLKRQLHCLLFPVAFPSPLSYPFPYSVHFVHQTLLHSIM